jgi:hypothetical protein
MNYHPQPLAGTAPPPPRPVAAPRPTSSPAPNPAFDRWLQAELARRYDDALAEPVPDALLRLLQPGN